MHRLQLALLIAVLATFADARAQNTQFEEILSTRGGQLEYPLTSFLASYSKEEARKAGSNPALGFQFFNTADFMQTRSLQREYVSMHDPRELASLTPPNSNKIAFNGPDTYIGHANANHEMEFISWDRISRRFEFFIVKNYGPDSKMTVEKANRAVCISCHQNEGPHFPRAPWSESGINSLNVALSLDARLVDFKGFLTSELKKKGRELPASVARISVGALPQGFLPNNASPILEEIRDALTKSQVPELEKLLDPNSEAVARFISLPGGIPGFDGEVRSSNRRILANKVCKELCAAQDQKCQTILLRMVLLSVKSAISQNVFEIGQEIRSSATLEAVSQRIAQNVSRLSIASSVLPDRLVNPENGKVYVQRLSVIDQKKIIKGRPLDLSILSQLSPLDRGKFNNLTVSALDFLGTRDVNERAQIMKRSAADPWYLTYQDNLGGINGLIFDGRTLDTHTEEFRFEFSEKYIDRGDPKFPRPKTDDLKPPMLKELLSNGLQSCVDPTAKLIAQVNSLKPKQIEGLSYNDLKSMIAGTDSAFGCADPKAASAINELQKSANEIAATQITANINHDLVYQAMTSNCLHCHASGGMYLPLNDANAIKTFRGPNIGATALEMLTKRQMPPLNSPYSIDENTRALWIQMLKEK